MSSETEKASAAASPDDTPAVAPADSGKSTGAADAEQSGEEKSGGEECGEEEGREEGDDNDDDVDWEELWMCPLTVRFTQDKIHPFFFRRGPIVNVVPKIRVVQRRKNAPGGADYELVAPFTSIHCLRKGEEMWSLDNRRLYALQLAAMEQWPQRCCIRLFVSDQLPRRKLKTQYRKFQTTSEGRAITVMARYQKFDTWSWFDRAVELELYTFSQRLGGMLSIFEMLPVVGALLFRTGLTGYASRMPLIVAFIMAFSVDLLRQKIPYFEKRICEFHVKAIMDGDVRVLGPCLRRLRWRSGDDQADDETTSAPQLAAMMALALTLLLPYVLGIVRDKLRTSLLSCWLGVACVLTVQLGGALWKNGTVEKEWSGINNVLHPKHKEER